MAKPLDIVGKKFGRLIVLERYFYENTKKNKNNSKWLCLCECGNTTIVVGSQLIREKIKSCGCYRKELAKTRWLDDDSRKNMINSFLNSWKNENRRLKVSERSSEMWENKEYVEKMRNRMILMWKDKNFYNRMKEMLKQRTGEQNPNWNGGVTAQYDLDRSLQEYKHWKINIYKKYNFTCQKCNSSKSGNLNAHHILNFSEYPELRHEVSNGICLCQEHHKEFHKIYGNKNNNLEQIQEFLGGEKHDI